MRLARVFTAAIFLLAGSCSMPTGAASDPALIDALERGSYPLPGQPGARVSYLRAGDSGARRVIFVHGTPGDARGWADFLLNVPPGLEYIAIDRPGFGASTPGEAEPSLARQAAAIVPLLVARDGKWPVLVGHSLGGPIVARVAADQPDRVAGLLILAGSLDPALERIHPMQPVGEWWGVRSLLPRALRNANRELLPLKRELEALAPALGQIGAPVTIIHGTADTLVPVANVPYMRERLTAAEPLEVELLAGQSHFLPWEHRDVIERALAAMVAR